jgi:hypothetical protein
MRFGQLDSQIAKCEGHLALTGTANSEVEFYLTQYLLVRIWAEYESRIKLLIERRCSRGNDAHISAFVAASAKIVTRDFKISDIKGHLGRFGDDYATAFRNLIDQPLEAAWNNIYTNRHAVAHGTGVQMTFRDLKEDYQKSQAVIDAVVTALAMRPRELKNLK